MTKSRSGAYLQTCEHRYKEFEAAHPEHFEMTGFALSTSTLLQLYKEKLEESQGSCWGVFPKTFPWLRSYALHDRGCHNTVYSPLTRKFHQTLSKSHS